jgi:hypothetical protein
VNKIRYIYQKFINLPAIWKLTLIFIVAFSIRLSMNIIFQGLNSSPNPAMGSDHIEYDLLAQNLASGKGFSLNGSSPRIVRAPGTSFLLFPIYCLFGVNYILARLMFCLIGASTCIIVYFIGKELANEKLGILSSAVLAIYPMHFYYSMHFFSEIPWAFFMSVAVWCILLFEKEMKIVYGVLGGIFIGFSTYVRPIAFFYIPFYILLWLKFYSLKNNAKFIKLVIIPLIFTIITIAPWIIRNYKITNHFIFICTVGGTTFWGAHNETILNDPKLIGGWISSLGLPERPEYNKIKTENEKEKAAYRYGFNFIKRHLKDMPRLEAMKVYRFITPLYETPNKTFNVVGGISWGVLSIFVAIGITATLNEKKFASLLAAVLLILFITLVFYGSHRFRETISPFLAIFASVGWLCFLRWIRKGKAILGIKNQHKNTLYTAYQNRIIS